MPSPPRPSLGLLLARGLRRRCPRCGHGAVFRTHWETTERCGACDLHFEREEGYWLGAMVVNLAVTELLFVALGAVVLLTTWPDVPWTALLVAAIATNAVVPVLFYPRSKTVWVALDLGLLQRMDDAR